jgi:hypothetical protein
MAEPPDLHGEPPRWTLILLTGGDGMNWRTAFHWGRNLFAVIGVLGGALLVVAVAAAISMESQYQQRANEAGKQPPASLDTAGVLMSLAGVRRNGDELLVGGVNPAWNEESKAEAYCVDAAINYDDPGWKAIDAVDPYLHRSAGVVFDFAHEKLACIPSADGLRNRRLQFKLISMELDPDGITQARMALRDPTGSYYLVNAWQPAAPKAVSSTPAPSTE